MQLPPYTLLDPNSPHAASAILLTRVVRGNPLKFERPWALYPLITIVHLPHAAGNTTTTKDGSKLKRIRRKGLKLYHLMMRSSTRRYIELWSKPNPLSSSMPDYPSSSDSDFVLTPFKEDRDLMKQSIRQTANELLERYEFRGFTHVHCETRSEWNHVHKFGRQLLVLREREYQDVMREVDSEVGKERSRNEIAEMILRERQGEYQK
ncbi:hypothetical protein CI109_101439 [Kwoniella shandongensis]|uniref:Uncharacterized protein n=1 Tax=Kwoniella shandongensis TaxID=1734106 RepID=A0A5M6BUK9_9TREE|nr:uncharacterized protein CI109_005134 [Kwoniella shandongensis]KAA5526558.1 hypothetical protein CI109_005134 [Kwoniella shandongensis]